MMQLYEEHMKFLEPDAAALPADTPSTDVLLLSIAISAKRTADTLETLRVITRNKGPDAEDIYNMTRRTRS